MKHVFFETLKLSRKDVVLTLSNSILCKELILFGALNIAVWVTPMEWYTGTRVCENLCPSTKVSVGRGDPLLMTAQNQHSVRVSWGCGVVVQLAAHAC